MKEKVIWVYWTGGYDSTFVVFNFLIGNNCELTGAQVQPIYLRNCDARRNSSIEEETMQELSELFQRRYPNDGDRLLPTIFVDCKRVHLDQDIVSGMWELCRTRRLTLPKSQYSYIAQAPRLFKHVIDSGAELAPGTSISQHVRPFINQEYMIDPESGPWYIQIFSGVRFPVVMVTKQQMWQIATQKGFADLLLKTWTCRVPKRVGDKIVPCGKCALCKERIITTMARNV